MLNQIQQYIYQALHTNDNVVRPKAEAMLFQLANQNTTDFFHTLASIIANEAKDINVRQSTGTVFSRLVSLKPNQLDCFYWDKVQDNARTAIKDLLLSTLISSETAIMKTGANTIAHIASIEIPRGEWLEIVNTLAQNAQHQDYNIRMASVITLGYICQELKNMKGSVNEESCKEILGGLLMSLQKQGEIVEVALTALRDSIQFLSHILEKKEFCNKTFEFLLPLLNRQQTLEKVYQILYEFCKYCYHLTQNYLPVIIQFTVAHMQLRTEESRYALSLWQTLGTEYLDRLDEITGRLNDSVAPQLKNLIMAAQRQILPQVMASILIVKPSDLDFAELRESAVQTLTVMVECGNREMVDSVTDGVSKILSSSNFGERQASALLFSCLCTYPDRQYIVERFKAGFIHLYKLLQDPQLIVVKNTLNGFVTLSQTFPEIFLANSQIKEIFNHLLMMAKHSDETVSLLSLTILDNVTDVLAKYPEPIANDPKQVIAQVVRMFEMGLKSQLNKQLNEKLIILLMNIIMSTPNMSIINQLVSHLITQYQYFVTAHIQDRAIILEHIVCVIHTCLLAMSKNPVPKTDHKDLIFQLIDQHIRLHGVQAEGINLISAALSCYKREFRGKVDIYWDAILQGLSMIDQKLIFKASLTCVSDIARNYESEVVDKISKVFQMLVSYMHENIDRQLKTDILKCFGDLALGLKKYTERFIDTLLDISENCFNAVYTFSQSQTEKAYAEELKESLIQMYHCLAFAVNSQQNCNNKMGGHFTHIATFVVKSCDVKYKPTVDYIKNCIYLILDSALFYTKSAFFKQQVANVLDSRELANLLEIMKKYQNDRPDIHDLLLYAEDKLKVRR